MSLIRCQNGHMFSERRYGTICPYCHIETNVKEKFREELPKEDEVEFDLMYQEIEPVCGWLVCIEGSRVGKDYKIISGKNFIGRADDMDIQIIGDNNISLRNHAIVVYDQKLNNYVLLPGESSGIAYLNGEPVYVPREISSYDVIELGKSKFLFISFCGDNFEWQDKEQR